MGAYKLSIECEADISEIYEYGIEKFGLIQSQEYMIGLHDLFNTLAENTNIGRDASEFYPSLKRFVYKSHMIFYLQSESGIFVVRTLSQSMDYQRHLDL
ncbi:MAG: type II toxin-antitoxin system RelE/ParE family toxin [Reichenbachiella sp.]|uniref:type II toxin-antitoxin system RelE/ParE family toxin n=1 Tax=Reichenbachiella sp. TaxID=2184521 RepID=UPI002966E977|nr:type II toxin-antitoxin system RelE/ParE family toxin [Reichenbachiella sp.]MDW3210614.1 type II toxin-antitoxin system RelE/ParE family toxin [Reichenbachiella sp.]